jgi:hypothetical protein
MKLLHRKSKSDALRDAITGPLAVVRDSARRENLLKAAMLGGSAAAITAGSAAISSLRRRIEPSRNGKP